jgi:hypothetical protein
MSKAYLLVICLLSVSLQYVVFDAWLGYHYVYFGYNLFLWMGIGAIALIVLEAAFDERQKNQIN